MESGFHLYIFKQRYNMRKFLRTIHTLVLLLVFASVQAQVSQVNNVTIIPGFYTPGSTIAATFTLGTECIARTNTFELYLSDATGSFANQTLIGSYASFYSTFVNGVIPANTPAGTGYQLRIRSTSDGLYSTPTAAFEVRAGTLTTASITSSSAINSANPNTYGFCIGRTGSAANIFLENGSTATGTVTASVTNELDGGPVQQITFNGGIQTFSPSLAHYTMLAKVVMPDGNIATRAYFIVNNVVNTAFSTTGAGLVCLPLGELSYGVDFQTASGIQKNFPGNVYHITWGDQTQDDYTYCQLVANGTVKHNYTKSSCGSSFNGKQNVFGINISTVSPFCGSIGQPLSTSAKVVTVTKNDFEGPATACTNTTVIFRNTSLPGQNQDDNSVDCQDNNVRYNWYINGQIVAANQVKSTPLAHIFTVSGVYTIRLESTSSGTCQGAPIEKTICIQAPPQPSFTLPGTAPVALCSPAVITPTNTSIIDAPCDPTVSWKWTIIGPGNFTYDNGTSDISKEPTFRFTTPGIYRIKLTVTTASCGDFATAEQTVTVNGTPTATLSPDIKLCNLNSYDFNNTTTGPTKTTFTGSFTATDATYSWTVTGGQFEYQNGTSSASQYPKILFKEFKEYTITVTHTNACGTISDTQVITFTQAPVVNAGIDQTLCFNDMATLAGSISAPVIGYTWLGGTGVFSDRNILNPTYTPSAAERSAGMVTLSLQATTELAAPCNTITDEIILTIRPQVIVTSAPTANICTNTNLNYQPTATPAGTNFTWTATGTPNAGGYTSVSTGTTLPISDILTNSDAINNATVTYIITPTNISPDNVACTGPSFTLTVTVTPRPVITAAAARAVICTGSAAGITMTSNLSGTRYTWTNVVTGGITGANTVSIPTTAAQIADMLSNPGTTQGSVTYTITPYSATGCAGTPFDITIAVDPAVTIANAGADESICDITSYTLNGNIPAVGTGIWTLTSAQTGVIINNPSQYNTTVTGLVGGQVYTFKWTISAPGACGPSFDEITVTVNTPTVAGTISADATVCQNINNGTITLTGNTGLVIRWENSTDGGTTWQPVNNTTITLNYTNLSTTTKYRAIVQNGSCASQTTNEVTITVTPASTQAVAGPNQIICNQSTALLDGNVPASGEAGMWTIVTGTPNTLITNPSDPKTTVTGLVVGQTYVFRWTITGTSACGPTSSEVTIRNLPPLTNIISSTSTEVCNGQVITITGSTPTGGNGTYSYTWESSADGNNWTVITGQTGKDLIYTLTSTLTFRRTVNSSACTLVSNTYTVIAQAPITNNIIAADQSICTGNVPVPLTGSIPTGSNGNFSYQWQSSVDNANWTDVSGAVFANYAPLALTTTTSFRRVVSTLTCTGNLRNISNAVTITVKPNAKAEFTYTLDKACTPFVIDGNNIKAVPYPDRNATYTWYADNVVIGTGINFPGYTISTSNATVTIKLVTTPSTGCLPDEMSHDFSTNPAVAATFTQSATQGCGPLAVTFVNTSTSLTTGTFRWNFGNGTTSSQVMPGAITFLPDPTGKDTTYTVTLTATTSCGTSSVTSTVFVKAKPIAVFSPSKTTGCSPMTVTFTNTSPGGTNTYYYDFGDGTLLTKTDKSPVQHTFITNTVRDFVVTMIAENECGRDQSSYNIRVSPNTVLPELVVNANEKEGCAPFRVNFYNNSRGANLFKYDFGDGSTVITRSAPEVVAHTFNTPGTYTITLTASNGCSDTTTTESITVLPQPLASFTADNTLGCPGLVVQFRNTSTDGVSYLWDFGDGTTSTEMQPRHVFTGDKEYYTISLTATNSLGCTYTAIMNEYIHVVAPPVARFNVAPSTLISIPNYTFRFENESTGNPTIWAWDFGDGVKSTLQNPSHTYLDTGSYVVTLRVSNQQGCFTTTFKTVTIVGVPGYLYVPNSFMPGSETPELRVFMAKGSGIKTWTLTVFNKWGQTLWQTNKLDEGRPVEWWDGVYNGIPVPQGVYFWKIDVEFINGTAWKGMTYDSKAPKKTGVIHLLR